MQYRALELSHRVVLFKHVCLCGSDMPLVKIVVPMHSMASSMTLAPQLHGSSMLRSASTAT
jgi:hypothetical protein